MNDRRMKKKQSKDKRTKRKKKAIGKDMKQITFKSSISTSGSKMVPRLNLLYC
jgi:hypothetical protein